jgi:hypothetical protein
MADQQSVSGIQPNKSLLIGGAVLLGLGGLLGATGVLLGATAIVSAARRWIEQLERPPGEIARQTWKHAKAATAAGTRAWQDVDS